MQYKREDGWWHVLDVTEWRLATIQEAEKQYQSWAGKSVKKRSGKPFKSGQKVATIRSTACNPYSHKLAFFFMEDDSVVDTFCVDLV